MDINQNVDQNYNQEINRQQALLIIDSSFKSVGLSISEHQTEQFFDYYQLLVETNKVMNLTAITDFDEVVLKHFIDSALICRLFDKKEKFPGNFKRLIDVGTGAGFPGIPLKIIFPELQVVLLDSLNKRIRFLNDVIDKLQLKDIIAVHSRAEDAGRTVEFRDAFDLCVSRAVANLSSLSEYCLPFVCPGGMFVSYKSSDIGQECDSARKAIHMLGGSIERIEKCFLPGTDIERSFILVRKEKETPRKYPRKAGIPSRNPL